MNFKEIDSATLERRFQTLRRDEFISAVCHGILGAVISVGLIAMLIIGEA